MRVCPPSLPASARACSASGTDRYSCYLRLAAPARHAGPWSGIVRLEVPQSAGLAEARRTRRCRRRRAPPLRRRSLARPEGAPEPPAGRGARDAPPPLPRGRAPCDSGRPCRGGRDARHSGRSRMSDTPNSSAFVGLVDGSAPATTRRFSLVLDDEAVVQLDDLVVSHQTLPDGREVAHYGIVVEGFGQIEGAELPSDTARITLAAHDAGRHEPAGGRPGAPHRSRAVAAAGSGRGRRTRPRRRADHRAVPRSDGPSRSRSASMPTRQPVFADFSFINGEKGGHVSISGISGVATKTTLRAVRRSTCSSRPRRGGRCSARTRRTPRRWSST